MTNKATCELPEFWLLNCACKSKHFVLGGAWIDI